MSRLCHRFGRLLLACLDPPVCPFVDHKAGWTFLMSLKVHSHSRVMLQQELLGII